MWLKVIGTLSVMAVVLASGTPAVADAPKKVTASGDWTGYTYTDAKDGKVCYMLTKPQKAEGNYTQRGDIFLFVTHRPKLNLKDEVSIETGYTYKSGSKAALTIDGRAVGSLATEGSQAWAETVDLDRKLVQGMRRGNRLVAKGTSSRGTATTDTYSLSGFTKTYNAITKACR